MLIEINSVIGCQYTLIFTYCLPDWISRRFRHFCDHVSLHSRIVTVCFNVLDTISCSSYSHHIKTFPNSVFPSNYYLFSLPSLHHPAFQQGRLHFLISMVTICPRLDKIVLMISVCLLQLLLALTVTFTVFWFRWSILFLPYSSMHSINHCSEGPALTSIWNFDH